MVSKERVGEAAWIYLYGNRLCNLPIDDRTS